jgi:hypothetical protein
MNPPCHLWVMSYEICHRLEKLYDTRNGSQQTRYKLNYAYTPTECTTDPQEIAPVSSPHKHKTAPAQALALRSQTQRR